MSIFGTPAFDGVGGVNAGLYASDALDVPDGALIVVCAMYSTGSAPLVSITDLDNEYTILDPITDGATDYSWGYTLSAVADPANIVTATFTGSGGFGGIAVWVIPISGGTVAFDVSPAIEAMSGSGNQLSHTFDTTGADEIGFCTLFDRNGVAGSAAWTAVSPASLDSGNYASTRSAADHRTWNAPATSTTIGLANAGSPLGGITAIAFMAVAPPTHSISGSAGHAGATVAYSGESSGSVMADGSGNYEIDGLADGDYTITPSLAGYSFTPASRDETLSGSDLTGVDFTATPNPTGPTRSTRSK